MQIDKDDLMEEFSENLDSVIDDYRIALRILNVPTETIEIFKKWAKLALEQTIAIMEEEDGI